MRYGDNKIQLLYIGIGSENRDGRCRDSNADFRFLISALNQQFPFKHIIVNVRKRSHILLVDSVQYLQKGEKQMDSK